MSNARAKATETETKEPTLEGSVEPSPAPDIPAQGDQSAVESHERAADALFEQGVEEARIEAAQKRMNDRAVAEEAAAHDAEIEKARLAEEA